MEKSTFAISIMMKSIKRNSTGILLMAVSALSLSVGQLLWKFVDRPFIDWSNINYYIALHYLVGLFPGFLVYVAGAMFMIAGLRKGELSVLQPMNSLSYIFSLILSVLVLHEHITLLTLVGIAIIMVGVFFIGGSTEC